MDHTAVSDTESTPVTHPINLAKRARGKYCNFAYFNGTVNTKTDINQIETKKIIFFRK